MRKIGWGLRGGFGNRSETSVREMDEQAVGMKALGMRCCGLTKAWNEHIFCCGMSQVLALSLPTSVTSGIYLF